MIRNDELHKVTPSFEVVFGERVNGIVRDREYWIERHYRRKARGKAGPRGANMKLLREGRCRMCLRSAAQVAADSQKHPRLTKHHLIPVRAGGRNHPDNIVPLCRACHDDVDKRAWPQRAQYRVALRAVLTEAETAYLVEQRSAAWTERHYPADPNAWIGMTEPDDWDVD